MYLWVGCCLPEEFAREIRGACLERNVDLGLSMAALELPQHISLKISFRTDDPGRVTEDLTEYLSARQPFRVRLTGAEQVGQILWMTVEENATLRQLHEELDVRLASRFGVEQHPFDKCFIFHSTLFMDPDTEKIGRMQQMLENYPIARELEVDTFLLGQSESGQPGDYRIIRRIKV